MTRLPFALQVELPRRDGNGAAPMDVEEEEGAESGPAAGDDDAVVELDYSGLKRELRKVADAEKVTTPSLVTWWQICLIHRVW